MSDEDFNEKLFNIKTGKLDLYTMISKNVNKLTYSQTKLLLKALNEEIKGNKEIGKRIIKRLEREEL